MMRAALRKSGFTLVEIALAMMVISVGLLAVFGLFPAGMSSNKNAIDDTYGAMFAEEVFNGVRAVLSTNNWNTLNWNNINIPERSSQKWGFPHQQIIRANRGLQTAEYRPAALEGDAVEFAVRYDLMLLPHPQDTQNRAYAILTLHVGQVGPTNNPLRVYTEFFNSRGVP